MLPAPPDVSPSTGKAELLWPDKVTRFLTPTSDYNYVLIRRFDKDASSLPHYVALSFSCSFLQYKFRKVYTAHK